MKRGWRAISVCNAWSCPSSLGNSIRDIRVQCRKCPELSELLGQLDEGHAHLHKCFLQRLELSEFLGQLGEGAAPKEVQRRQCLELSKLLEQLGQVVAVREVNISCTDGQYESDCMRCNCLAISMVMTERTT